MKTLRLMVLFLLFSTNAWASSGYTVDFSSATGVPSTTPTYFQINNIQVGVNIGTASLTTVAYAAVFEWDYTIDALKIHSLSTASDNCSANLTLLVNDAQTGTPISGATAVIESSSETTNSSGEATFTSLSVSGTSSMSNVNVTVSASGYVSSTSRVALSCSSTTRNTVSLVSSTNTSVQSGDIKIVLSWGTDPRDLDSHLTGPTTSSGTFHVYYADKNASGTAPNLTPSDSTIPSYLDIDDTSSYGPETITISSNSTNGSFLSGTYKYSVHHYSGSSDIPNSGATVKIYQGTSLLRTFYPPTGTAASGSYWSAFTLTISNGTVSITEIGTYGTTYASKALPRETRIGLVHPEDPGIFRNLPSKE